MTEQDNSYIVASLRKEDLIKTFPEYAQCIEPLSDNEMARIADKVSDAIQESFSVALLVILDLYFRGQACVDEHAVHTETDD